MDIKIYDILALAVIIFALIICSGITIIAFDKNHTLSIPMISNNCDPIVGRYDSNSISYTSGNSQSMVSASFYFYNDNNCYFVLDLKSLQNSLSSTSLYNSVMPEYFGYVYKWHKVGDHYEIYSDLNDKAMYLQLTSDGIQFPNTGLSQYVQPNLGNTINFPINFTRNQYYDEAYLK